MKISRITTENGINLVHYYLPSTNSVTASFLFNVGSTKELRTQRGMSHFFEHMVFNGSKKYPDQEKSNTLLEQYGIIQNAWTFKNCTNYWMKSPLDHFKLALDVLIDRAFYPLLNTSSVEKEKSIITEEYHMAKDSPHSIVSREFTKALFTNSLKYSVLGKPSSFQKFTKTGLGSFHKKHYNLENSILWIGGNITLKKTLKLLQPYRLPKGRKTVVTRTSLRKKRKNIAIFKEMPSNTYHAVLGFSGSSIHDSRDQEILSLISYILGIGRGSLLYKSLKGTNSLVSYLEVDYISFREGSIFGIYINSEQKKLIKITTVIREALERIISGKLPSQELERARNLLLSNYLSLQEVSHLFGYSPDLFNMTRRELLTGEKLDYHKKIELLRSIALPDIENTLKEVLRKGRLGISLVGKSDSALKEMSKIFFSLPK